MSRSEYRIERYQISFCIYKITFPSDYLRHLSAFKTFMAFIYDSVPLW
jgi:hypothetical protein